MHLELSQQQARELLEALTTYIGELHDEVAHTDRREYKAALREKWQRLDGLRRQLEHGLEGEQAYA